MSEGDFTPRLGRIRDRGAAPVSRYGKKVAKRAARYNRSQSRSKFTGTNIGRGAAAARLASFRTRSYDRMRMRRVVVKIHISRARHGIGKAAYRAHLKYIQRDGVDHDGTGGDLYDRNNDRITDGDFLSRSEDDRHQFRVIFSAEDADQLADLKENTRAFMERMEKDLGTKLDWVAVDHHNTGHPHTHIVIRGVDERGNDLVMAKEYITKGMRELGQEIVTERLGPRRDLEIARSQASEISKERYTGIDREIAGLAQDNKVHIDKAQGPFNRFRRSLQIQRLGELEKLKLATREGQMKWALEDGWEDKLKALGKRGDVIRSISAAMGTEKLNGQIKQFNGKSTEQKPVLGRVTTIGPEDELRDTRFILVEDKTGAFWHVSLGARPPGALPKEGAIVEITTQTPKARQADRTIAAIADKNDGIYSDALHQADDPNSKQEFREAHKRRLEALRRAGLVERLEGGSWQIGNDFLSKAASLEARRNTGAKLDVKSWLPLEELIENDGATWLEQTDRIHEGSGAFGKALNEGQKERLQYLKRAQILGPDDADLNIGQKQLLAIKEQQTAAASIAAKSRRAFVYLESGKSLQGIYEKPIDLAQGRFAIVDTKSKEFTLVPWRPELEKYRGKEMMIRGTNKGVGWSLGRKKGIGR